jgi:hypothetical protein
VAPVGVAIAHRVSAVVAGFWYIIIPVVLND